MVNDIDHLWNICYGPGTSSSTALKTVSGEEEQGWAPNTEK